MSIREILRCKMQSEIKYMYLLMAVGYMSWPKMLVFHNHPCRVVSFVSWFNVQLVGIIIRQSSVMCRSIAVKFIFHVFLSKKLVSKILIFKVFSFKKI